MDHQTMAARRPDTRSKENLATCKLQPIGERHPCAHIYDAGGNRCPQIHEIAFEKPDLDRSRDRAKNDPGDRSLYQHGIVKRWYRPIHPPYATSFALPLKSVRTSFA